ncbi:MAG: hypothetical protein LBH07_04625 [Treponema sp.]|jgi:hypothetical protein|nr:hypothetical protein [Treponema sp.]
MKIILLLIVFFPASLQAQQWYKSNQAGIALERIPSRMVALHQEWALSVERVNRTTLPAILRYYDNTSYSLEQRLLYERGKIKRRQWIFRDAGGVTRVNASLPADLSAVGKEESIEVPAFVEIFASNRTLTEFHQYLSTGIYTTRFTYREGLLIRSDTFLDKAHLWIDLYRYTRSAMLRYVERNYLAAGTSAAFQGRSSQPPLNLPGLDLRPPPPIADFVSPGSLYDNSIMTEVLDFIYNVSAAKVIYNTDNQGRITSETRYNEEDEILAVITNEWTGDKISAILWSAPPDKGRIVFRYSGKDRISEENFRNDVLERKVNRQGDQEIEEIFMNGKAILRTVWEDGRKVSEEELR